MNVNDYIKSEVDRQHRDNYDDFQRAWVYARETTHHHRPEDFGDFVRMLAMLCEPTRNGRYISGKKYVNYRRSEVGFLHGVSVAPKAIEVPDRFRRWAHQCFHHRSEATHEQFTKDLLDIHPWEDGNGRTASILRNWMLGTLDDPTPLPYYYGDGPIKYPLSYFAGGD